MSANAETAIRVGPAGWSYEDWKGIVYPPHMPKSLHPLTFLCEFFDTVEVNSSFYAPPNARNCAAWVKKVSANPRFKFTVKLWERFTHERGSEIDPNDVKTYCEGIAPLADQEKLGAILVQFPFSFRRTPGNRVWLARVIDAFASYPLAIEIRHATWDRPEVHAAMRERSLAFCNIDQPLFPGSLEPTDRVTSKVGYVRLHGRNHDDWFREEASRDDRYNYLYSPEELKPWLEKIERIRSQAGEIYVITNNHYRGQAVVNAFDIQAGLGIRDVTIPQHLIDEYPQLKHLFMRV